MAHWPLKTAPVQALDLSGNPSGATTTDVAVVGAGTAHTKGSWTTIIASTASDVSLVALRTLVTNTSATDSSALLDIAIGGSGSEVVIVENLAVGYNSNAARMVYLPLNIPAGTRIAARVQGAQTSKSISIGMQTFGGETLIGGQSRPGGIDTYGANTATSRGVTLTAGGANSMGSWFEITSSTPRAVRNLIVLLQGAGVTAMNSRNHLVDIGIGGSGSETVIVPNVYVVTNSAEAIDVIAPIQVPNLNLDIPAGTRIAARHQCTTASDAQLDVIVYGIR